jgi:transcriptional regulator of acetoin/glycerol metabolism
MRRASVRLHAAGDRLAVARDRFLVSEPVDPRVVRAPILASWWRSRKSNVAADRLDLSYLRAPDLESTLARGAEPVVRRLHEELDGQPISVILTDAYGLVLLRFTGDRDLERHLDSIMLAPGFSYAEDLVGTNGIGTALECGGPAHVFGHEHYAEHLEGMACAGTPIREPVSGRTLGVLDLTCWRKDADSLMISLAQSTARQIGESLAASSNSRDQHLLQEYLRSCRHSGGIVLALGNDVVMLNDHARHALSPPDQAALIARATDVLAQPRPVEAVTVDLPSGTVARMFCRRVGGDASSADGVVHVKIVAAAMPEPRIPAPRSDDPGPYPGGSGMWPGGPGTRSGAPEGERAGAPAAERAGSAPDVRVPAPGIRVPAPGVRVPAPGVRVPAPGIRVPAPGIRVPAPRQPVSPAPSRPPMPSPCRPRMALPGLVGSGAAWRRACRDAEGGYDTGEWLALDGENGAGKLSLVRAVHQRRSPAAPFHVIDVRDALGPDTDSGWLADLRRELLDGTGMFVIRHGDAADARLARILTGALQEARAAGKDAELRVAMTLDRSRARADLTALMRFFPGTVEVPPLRHHSEDLTELVPFFLARLSQHGHLSCSAAAMQLLLRNNWPGNASQLWDVLKQVVQRRRAGAILPQDLPPECWTVSRRVLSPLESMERDAIVRSLIDHEGNKIRAARALGMSRATIYRRIREYGIVTTP